MSRFLISILCLNRLAATRACLDAVFANSEDYDLVIQNNASTDGTREFLDQLKRDHPEVTVIHNPTNEGFIVPNCRAFEMAKERGCEYFIALNNDTVPPSGWLNWLALPLDLDPNAALSGPGGGCHRLMNNFDGTGGGAFEYVEGACLCAKVSLVSKYGPLFSSYLDFIYGDDSDLSLRMREKGHSIHEAGFHLEHSRGETVQTQPEVKARCNAAQQHNHRVLMRRWEHYLKVRRFDYPILVRRRYALGDVLLITPVLRAIKEANPLSPIFVETDTPEILFGNPVVHKAARAFVGEDLRDALVVDLNMAYENRPMMHIVRAYEEAARETVRGLGSVYLRTEIYPGAQEMGSAGALRNRFAGPQDKLCAVHAEHTNWPGKNWPHAKFAAVVDGLISRGWTIAVVGKSVPPAIRNHGVIDFTGGSVLDLAARLRFCQLFIGNDSFPMNVAMAVGCPTIGIFGCSSPRFIMTEGAPHIGLSADPKIPCAGQRHRSRGITFLNCDPACVDSVSVDQVLAAVEALNQ